MKSTIKLKVEQLERKNQFLITTDKGYYFQSYNSLIAFYDIEKRTLTLGVDWDYSNTTRQHLYIFIDRCVPSLYLGFFSDMRKAKSKRAFIQKCIDKQIIKYDGKMI